MSKKYNWSSFGLEFLSVFIAVLAAFGLNNWNDQRKSDIAENKILTEILSGLEKDLIDINLNALGREMNIKSVNFFRDAILGKEIDQNLLIMAYFNVTRDLISLQNVSGYETLKSRGFELVKNDSLRNMIISLYEYDFASVKVFEENYSELSLHESYYDDFNRAFAPYFVFNEQGVLDKLKTPVQLSLKEKNILLGHFMKIDHNNLFIKGYYNKLKRSINLVIKKISQELDIVEEKEE